MCEMALEVGSQKHKGQVQSVDTVQTLVGSDRKLGVRLIAEESITEICSGGKDPNSGLTRRFSTMTMLLCI
jgi:hypothetical protein